MREKGGMQQIAMDGTGQERWQEEESDEGTTGKNGDNIATTQKTCTPQLDDEMQARGEIITSGTERNLRKRKKETYDQIKRRQRTRTAITIYLERREGRGLQKRRAIIMGTATIERIVKGQYEWRDGGMRDTKGKRKRYWAATREEGNDGEETESQRTRMASG